MSTVHLILKHRYYDEIDEGKKLIEYRRNIPYYRKRVLGRSHVIFHRGYTNLTMTFHIKDTILKDNIIEIHLDKRV